MKGRPNRQAAANALAARARAEAWGRRDYAAFFELIRRAESLSPNDPTLLLEMGTAYGRRTQFTEAKQCFERAVDGSRDKSRMLAVIALQCRNFLRYDLAEHFLGRAAHEPGVPPDTLAKLAEMKERVRETAAAEEAVERALKTDPKCQLALLVHARLNRVAGRLEEAEKIVRSFLSRTDRTDESTRIRGWYELAAILDREGRYDEAFEALTTAKKMILPNAAAAFTVQRRVHRGLRRAEAELTAGHLQRWSASDPDPAARRIAVIAGHPRSGTTLLEQLLDAHSAVVSAEETEIFFDTYHELDRNHSPATVAMLDSLSAANLRAGREEYFRRMDLFVSVPTKDRLLIDKNPSLTAVIPGLIRILPQVQIIVALRDPRDVCLSCFMQPLPFNRISAMFLTMEGTVEEYCSLMGFWHTIKPLLPRPALEVRYEDVVADMQSEAEKTLRFLNLEWEPAILNFHEHARKKLVRSPTYADVARPVSSGAIGRWKHYRKHLEPHLAKLAPLVAAFGYEAD